MKRLVMIGAAFAAVMLAAPAALAQQEPEQPRMMATSAVNLRALDKITGNARDFSAKVGDTWTFGRLKGTVRACYQSRPQDTPESAVFMEIRAVADPNAKPNKPTNTSRMNKGPQPIGPDGLLFSGWMFSSTPGISALEHPTYDVWVISCNAPAP